MILVPVNDRFDPDELRAMVSEINTTQVAPDEVLSDNVYIYRRGADGIAVAWPCGSFPIIKGRLTKTNLKIRNNR